MQTNVAVWNKTSDSLPTDTPWTQIKVLFHCEGWAAPRLGLFSHWGKNEEGIDEISWWEYNQDIDRFHACDGYTPEYWIAYQDLY